LSVQDLIDNGQITPEQVERRIADEGSFETAFHEIFMRRNVTGDLFGILFLPVTITRPMPMEITPYAEGIANDEDIRRMNAIRNEPISEKQSQF
jgi:hypothetical protein